MAPKKKKKRRRRRRSSTTNTTRLDLGSQYQLLGFFGFKFVVIASTSTPWTTCEALFHAALFFLIHFRYCNNSYNINNKNCSHMLHVKEHEKKKKKKKKMMMMRILQQLLWWFLNLRDSHHFQTLFLKFSQPISCYKAQACNNNCRL